MLSLTVNFFFLPNLHKEAFMPTRGLIVVAFRLPLNRVSVWGLQSEKLHLGELGGPSLRDCSSLSGVSMTVYLFIHSRSGALDQRRPRFLLSFQ